MKLNLKKKCESFEKKKIESKNFHPHHQFSNTQITEREKRYMIFWT